MYLAKISDEQLLEELRITGSPKKIAEKYGMAERTVHYRRQKIEKKLGIKIIAHAATQNSALETVIGQNKRIITHQVQNGNIFIASDCHYWPGEETVAHKAFVKLLSEMKAQTVVLNGDVFDGAQVSRHPPLMGVQTPTPKQEIEACQDRLDEIAQASKNARKFWTFGNHDARLFAKIAAGAPELTDMVSLWDYFPGWHTGWRIDVNQDVIIKHRWHNGQHATYNNILKSGVRCLVTGHLHKLQIYPWSDFQGRKWGVDAGTIAEPYGDQFAYTEGNPVNWCSGFAVLTFKDGMLLPPELCEVINGVAYFRGKPV